MPTSSWAGKMKITYLLDSGGVSKYDVHWPLINCPLSTAFQDME